MSSHLQAAVHSHAEARLDHLLAAWQATRQPEVARSIAELGAAAGRSLNADPHDLDAWHAQASGAPARIRGELLDRLDMTNWRKALAQLEVIGGWSADPRTVDALLALIDRAPYRSHPARVLWQRVYDLLGELADPRALAALPEPEGYARQFPREETQRSIARRLTDLRERLAALPEPPALTDAEAELLSQLRPSTTTKPVSEAQLLADIYANPEDDTPRAVYADLLSSRGDPRGELIALQLLAKLGKPQRDRIKQLLRDHQIAWLGELADVALALDLRYERGFPAAITLDGGASQAAIERLTGHAAWRTVHALDVRGDRPGYADFLADEVFFGLRELTSVSATALLRFVVPAPRGLTRMVLSGDFEDALLPASIREGILSGVGLPQLRTLGLQVDRANRLTSVLASPLGQALTRLELAIRPRDDAGCHRILAAVLGNAPPQLRELIFAWGFAYELTRDGDGWSMVATYHGGSKSDRFHMLTDLLTALREQGHIERLTKLKVEHPRFTPQPEDLLRLRRAARGLL
ncbi:MAG TPA: TIGR02996 domain-containing protein [Enhygromyxa sp.]|nr:TIGR02996 domain-containing protein [Enhygromyxa sp.]